jgi:hypothetical protein
MLIKTDVVDQYFLSRKNKPDMKINFILNDHLAGLSKNNQFTYSHERLDK